MAGAQPFTGGTLVATGARIGTAAAACPINGDASEKGLFARNEVADTSEHSTSVIIIRFIPPSNWRHRRLFSFQILWEKAEEMPSIINSQLAVVVDVHIKRNL